MLVPGIKMKQPLASETPFPIITARTYCENENVMATSEMSPGCVSEWVGDPAGLELLLPESRVSVPQPGLCTCASRIAVLLIIVLYCNDRSIILTQDSGAGSLLLPIRPV